MIAYHRYNLEDFHLSLSVKILLLLDWMLDYNKIGGYPIKHVFT
jgi:hypothetical protein